MPAYKYTREFDTPEPAKPRRALRVLGCQTPVHDLRHSHASLLIEMGFSPLEIADRLGHESVKTTLDTYSHLYPDKDRKLADRLDQLRR